VDLEPVPPPPLPSLKQRDREKLLKKLEQSIADEFRQRVSEGQGPVADVDIKNLLGRRPPPQTLRFESQAPPRPEKETFSQMLARYMEEEPVREETFTEKLMRHLHEPEPREETFTEKLERHLQTPEPREETFTEKLERHLQEPPDFRNEGEKRRDEPREEARRKPPVTPPPRRRAGLIPDSVPLGEGASFEDGSLKPPVDSSGVDPETVLTLEGRKIIGRDTKGNMLAEGSVVGSSTFYTRNSAGEFSAINPPILVGWGVEIRVSPPAKEYVTAYYGLGRHLSAGIIYGSDEDGRPATGIALNIGLSVPLGIPYVLSTPIDPKEIIKEIPEEFTPGG
jgi:hypothetical protein